MAKLSGPYEIFDIGDGEEVEFQVVKIELGDVEIHPGYGEATKLVQGLRLHLTKSLWEGRLPYIDITSNRLRVMLLEHLKLPDFRSKVFRVKKHGIAPKATFELMVTPLPRPR